MIKKMLMIGSFLSILCTSGVEVFANIEQNVQSKAETVKETQSVLYGVSVSPFVRKVKVILDEKKIPFQQIEVLPLIALKATKSKIPQDFLEVSPLGKIPAYREGDWSIADSGVIADYLEARYPVMPLYPADPHLRAKAKWFEKYGDETLSSVIHNKIFMERFVKPLVFKKKTNEKMVQQAIQKELPPLFDYLEKELGEKAFIVGDQFTVADIAIVTHFISLEKSNVKLDQQKWPKLFDYVQRVLKRESFQKAL